FGEETTQGFASASGEKDHALVNAVEGGVAQLGHALIAPTAIFALHLFEAEELHLLVLLLAPRLLVLSAYGIKLSRTTFLFAMTGMNAIAQPRCRRRTRFA